MVEIPTKEWDDISYPGLMFCHTSSQGVLHIYPNTYESQEVFSRNKRKSNIMCVGYTILSAAA